MKAQTLSGGPCSRHRTKTRCWGANPYRNRAEKDGTETDTAVLKIGNDVSLYQTLPIAFFLISRYQRPADLLTVAAHVGGNTDTIGFICGAYLGASKGIDAIPADLLEGLEDRQRIEILSQRIFDIYTRKLET